MWTRGVVVEADGRHAQERKVWSMEEQRMEEQEVKDVPKALGMTSGAGALQS